MPTQDRTEDAGRPLLDELLQVVPRWVDRTRSQAELALSLASMLPCVGSLLSRGPVEERPGVPEHERVDVLSVLSADDLDESPGQVPADAAPDEVAAADEPNAADQAAPVEAELPIQDYDSLAASQVVPRLATLGPDELRAVQAYEAGTRRRQTILNRVAQLLSA